MTTQFGYIMRSKNSLSNSVTVVITCLIKTDQLQIAKKELKDVINIVLDTEPACHGIRVHEDPDNPQSLLIIEYWDSKEHFLGPHMQTPHMIEFFKKTELFLEGEAEFSFWREVEL
jgi:quinol monooxygenase YgiN